MVRICFVCLGNICRSPTAEAVMKHLVRQARLEDAFHIESAGTGDWHVGEPRDRRSLATGAARGIPLSGRAQQFTAADFARFDYVVAMDSSNRDNLREDGARRRRARQGHPAARVSKQARRLATGRRARSVLRRRARVRRRLRHLRGRLRRFLARLRREHRL